MERIKCFWAILNRTQKFLLWWNPLMIVIAACFGLTSDSSVACAFGLIGVVFCSISLVGTVMEGLDKLH